MYWKILTFWFEEIDQSQWWEKDDEFDRLITDKFSEVHLKANNCELYEWRQTAKGRLAEIIVLDQFSRNIFRDTPRAFVSDSLALALSQEAISVNADNQLNAIERNFLYLPFMHSESVQIHEIAVQLYQRNGIQANLDFEIKHKEIIDRFGRYPHRNEILGRESTEEEIEFLRQPNSAF